MPDEFQPAWQAQLEEPIKEAPREQIGGWLLYFCLGFVIFGPASLIRAIANSTQLSWTITYIVLLIFTMLAGITTGLRLRSAFTFIWLALIMRLIYAGLQLNLAHQLQGIEDQSDRATQEFTSGVGNVVLSLTWFRYFKVSSRVERTFGRNI